MKRITKPLVMLACIMAIGWLMASIFAAPLTGSATLLAPPTQPAVYRQNMANHHTWATRNVGVVFGYEPEANPNTHQPTVTMAQWKKSCVDNGLKYICEPSSDLVADAADVNQIGWLQPLDEPDGKIITALDQNKPEDAEAIYKQLETTYAILKAASPSKPIWTNLDGNQIRWRQGTVNFGRILKACDYVSFDYYPIQRNEPVTVLAQVADQAVTLCGSKLQMAFIETSNQNLDPAYYVDRPPTPDELAAEIKIVQDRHLDCAWFPQRLPQEAPPKGNGIGFAWDNTPPELVPLITSVGTVTGVVVVSPPPVVPTQPGVVVVSPPPVVPTQPGVPGVPGVPTTQTVTSSPHPTVGDLTGAEIIINNQRYFLREK